MSASVIDAAQLGYLVAGDSGAHIDPSTGRPVDRAKDRIEHLVAELDRLRETLIVPTPALAEVLVLAGDAGPAFLERISKSSRIKVVDFDTRAAVEVAAMTRDALRDGDKFAGSTAPWQKVKIDRQIIAITRVNGAQTIYSDDVNLTKFAESIGLKVVGLRDLPLPPEPEPDIFGDVPA